VVGLDEQNKLLYTSRVGGDRQSVLHSFDLVTGRQTSPSMPMPVHSGNIFLSPDKTMIAAGDFLSIGIQLFAVATGKRVASLSLTRADLPIDALCFSSDSRRIAARAKEDICIWEISSGQLLNNFRLPTDGIDRIGLRLIIEGDGQSIALSDDGHYLATTGDGRDDLFVYDLKKVQPLKRFSMKASPRFLPDGQSVLLTPWHGDEKGYPSSYRIGSAEVTRFQTPGEEALAPHYWFATRGNSLIAFSEEDRSVPFIELLPKGAQEKIGDWLGPSTKVRLAFWDLQSGRLQRWAAFSHSSPIPFHYFDYLKNVLEISDDGRWIMVGDGTSLTCWDADSSRSPICWMICLIIVLFSCQLAWPRRVKLT
jgi:WD40 repeat protein